MEHKEEIKETPIADLFEMMSWKDEFPDEAKKAFHLFCFHFENEIKEKAEIYCSNWGYNEVVALDIVKCTLAKVWKHPTFDLAKSKAKSAQKGVVLWLSRIIFTQLANFHNNGTCYQPDEESDLSLVYTFDDLADRASDSEERKNHLQKQLEIVEKAFAGLSDKHKIIYLTYKLYEQEGRNIPRAVTKKLREELNLVQSSIRKYKEEATKQLREYLNRINE